MIMIKKTKRILKRFGVSYLDNLNKMYGPCLRCGVNPFI